MKNLYSIQRPGFGVIGILMVSLYHLFKAFEYLIHIPTLLNFLATVPVWIFTCAETDLKRLDYRLSLGFLVFLRIDKTHKN